MKTPKKKLSLSLAQTPLEKHCKQLPLGEILIEAMQVIDQKGLMNGGERQAAWLARRAIRAVCEAVIKAGTVPFPLKVEFVAPRGDAKGSASSFLANARRKTRLIDARCIAGKN